MGLEAGDLGFSPGDPALNVGSSHMDIWATDPDCMLDPGLADACKTALEEANLAASPGGGPRVCTANSLSRYWADAPMDAAEQSEALVLKAFLSIEEVEQVPLPPDDLSLSLSWQDPDTGLRNQICQLITIYHDQTTPVRCPGARGGLTGALARHQGRRWQSRGKGPWRPQQRRG